MQAERTDQQTWMNQHKYGLWSVCRAPELAAGSGAAPMFSNSAQSGPTTSAGVEGEQRALPCVLVQEVKAWNSLKQHQRHCA